MCRGEGGAVRGRYKGKGNQGEEKRGMGAAERELRERER